LKNVRCQINICGNNITQENQFRFEFKMKDRHLVGSFGITNF